MKEERYADQRGEHTEVQLDVSGHETNRDVGGKKQARAAQCARQEHPARHMSYGGAQQMRHHQTDKCYSPVTETEAPMHSVIPRMI